MNNVLYTPVEILIFYVAEMKKRQDVILDWAFILCAIFKCLISDLIFRSANPFFVLFLRSIVPLKSVWFLMQYVHHDDRFGTELSKFCTFEVTEL